VLLVDVKDYCRREAERTFEGGLSRQEFSDEHQSLPLQRAVTVDGLRSKASRTLSLLNATSPVLRTLAALPARGRCGDKVRASIEFEFHSTARALSRILLRHDQSPQ